MNDTYIVKNRFPLAKPGVISERRLDGNFSPRQMNKILIEPDGRHRNVTHPALARLASNQH